MNSKEHLAKNLLFTHFYLTKLFGTIQEMFLLAKASVYFAACTMYELFTNLAATMKRDEHNGTCKSPTPAAQVSHLSRGLPDLKPRKKLFILTLSGPTSMTNSYQTKLVYPDAFRPYYLSQN